MADSHTFEVEQFWQAFLKEAAPKEQASQAGYQAWGFGSTSEMADELGGLALRGVKTATASLVWSYEDGANPYPMEGGYSVILDGRNRPLCVIRTVRLYVRPFDEVDAEQAYLEGEGERTLASWRADHWKFFTEECRVLGRQPDSKMPVLCERFERVYPIPSEMTRLGLSGKVGTCL